jgi:GDP-4-dehydro-6-deoxy-D-mannose reductase
MAQMTASEGRRRLLLTGARGFVGAHVLAAARTGCFGGWDIVAAPAGWDIRDLAAVENLVEDARPEAVLHLAAQSFVPRSFQDPAETFDINLGGTLRLLQSLRGIGFGGRLLYVSSADIYGSVPDAELPVTESRWPEPRSPYGVSKFAAEQLCLQWHRTEGTDVVIARPFNHVGPGQDAKFVLPALARQIVAIRDGRQPPVMDVGDIDTTRDFTDVRDVVAAYAGLLSKGWAGDTYVIGSGIERKVRDILSQMCAIAGVSPQIHQDPARMRPAEQRRMVADASKLRAHAGWAPIVPFEQTLQDILIEAKDSP